MSITHNFFKSILLFAMGALLGLALYLLGASALGWIQPIWWGGDALFIPVFFGVAFIIIGAAPFCIIARKWMDWLAGTSSSLGTFVVGAFVGVGFLPVNDLFGMLLRPVPFWQSLDPWLAVVFALVIAGVLCSVLAATLVGIFIRWVRQRPSK